MRSKMPSTWHILTYLYGWHSRTFFYSETKRFYQHDMCFIKWSSTQTDNRILVRGLANRPSKIWTTTQSLTIGRGKALKGRTWFAYRYLSNLTVLVYARMLDHPQPASHHSHSFMHLFTQLPDFILLWWLTKTLRITRLFAFVKRDYSPNLSSDKGAKPILTDISAVQKINKFLSICTDIFHVFSSKYSEK